MKIYFTASLTGKKEYQENYRQVFSCLEKLNCKVKDNDVSTKSRKEVENKTQQEKIAFFEYLNKTIKWCDMVVAEVSYPSTSVGYEISLALKKDRPVLALYFEKKGDYPLLLKVASNYLKEEKITLLEYNFQNLESLLRNYVEFIKTKALDKRFTMLISPKISTHLSQTSKKRGMSQAEYIRDLIENDMVLKK